MISRNISLSIILLFSLICNAQIGIGTTTPNPSSILEISSTSKGLLIPRLTTSERDLIPSPPAGLILFNTTHNSIEFSNGVHWVHLNDNTTTLVNTGTIPSGLGSVGIGTTTPNGSAVLDLVSTNQGLLPPRMTASQRNGIASPVQGLMVYCTNCGSNGEAQFYNGADWVNLVGGISTIASFVCGDPVTFIYNGSSVTYGTVTGANSRCWLDRNLGANQVATSSTDFNAYGDLFQWGRGADGHQTIIWSSSTGASSGTPVNSEIAGQSSYTNPGPNFLIGSSNWYNGIEPSPNLLWQGVNGVNNPCPMGYRLPTESEWDIERANWTGATNSTGAANSSLKLTATGYRGNGGIDFGVVGFDGYYWSSSIDGPDQPDAARVLFFYGGGGGGDSPARANGASVRCLKE